MNVSIYICNAFLNTRWTFLFTFARRFWTQDERFYLHLQCVFEHKMNVSIYICNAFLNTRWTFLFIFAMRFWTQDERFYLHLQSVFEHKVNVSIYICNYHIHVKSIGKPMKRFRTNKHQQLKNVPLAISVTCGIIRTLWIRCWQLSYSESNIVYGNIEA